jgi:hypothetical protein
MRRQRRRPDRMRCLAAATMTVAFLGLGAETVSAHHSFAVFFNAESEVVSVTGTVKEFRFANPHGLIALAVKTPTEQTEWQVETNSPSILRRRGWTRDSLKVGELVTVKGWPARDGSRYMRMRDVLRADGSMVGQPLAPAGR